jgi:hypothetical protein
MSQSHLPISIVAVDSPEGMKHYVALVPPGVAFTSGIVPEAILGVLLRPIEQGLGITPDNFVRNSVFADFLHSVVARYGSSVPGLIAEAKRQGEGHIYIVDGRAPTPQDRVAPEDIVGAFQVKEGKVVEGSYKSNPNHAVLTVNGFFRLEPLLQQQLYAAISDRA